MTEVIKAILFTPIQLNLVSIFILVVLLTGLHYFLFIHKLRIDLLAADLAIKLQCKKLKEQSEELKAYTSTRVRDSQLRLLKSLETSIDTKLKEEQARRRR